ncbi:hypothetical protein F5B17DRAFT_410561 [Nemania serpens]|nr:hypothetical protein F5B17DRAFT_410561 [Nemania serpens]
MSEQYNKSRATPMEKEWYPTGHQFYPPPRDISQYVSRALPLLPTGIPSGYISPSTPRYAPVRGDEQQHTFHHFSSANKAGNGPQRATLGGAVNDVTNDAAIAMVRPPRIAIPEYSQPYENPNLVSPQPQRPDSRLMSLWASGDELVSPLDTPGTISWKTHIVSPMSENSEGESWFDDTSSDEGDQAEPLNPVEEASRSMEGTFPVISHLLPRKMSLRHSDPGSPLNMYAGGFGEPGPDVGRSQHLDDLSGRQTVQPQVYAQSAHIGDEPNHPQDADMSMGELTISFTVPNTDTFSWGGPGVSQWPMPPSHRRREEQPAQESFVETPFPRRASSASSQRSVIRAGELGFQQKRRRSGLGGFDNTFRPPGESIQQPPPGFTEMFSRLDSQGVASTAVPKVRGILSKAKQGLGIGSDEARREKRREEFKRQIHHHNTQNEA